MALQSSLSWSKSTQFLVLISISSTSFLIITFMVFTLVPFRLYKSHSLVTLFFYSNFLFCLVVMLKYSCVFSRFLSNSTVIFQHGDKPKENQKHFNYTRCCLRLSRPALCIKLLSGIDGRGLWLIIHMLDVSPHSLSGILRSALSLSASQVDWLKYIRGKKEHRQASEETIR